MSLWLICFSILQYQTLILVKLLNSVSFNKCIYKDLIMATFPCKSNKRRCKKKKKKKKKITCPYGHNFITLVICKKYTYYKIKLAHYYSKQYAAKSLQKLSKGQKFDWLIVLGFNDTSTLVGHFVSSPREREKSDRRDSRRDEREEQGRKRNRNESEETEEIKTFPLYPNLLQG